ncbi:MAG: hypothetical protein KGL99_19435, partial [Burkholderiales bacterium]|nr:hypothetical protein [Burkholderiales bacterium]
RRAAPNGHEVAHFVAHAARAGRETPPAFVASKPAQAGSEPRHLLPSGGRSMYSSDEGLS